MCIRDRGNEVRVLKETTIGRILFNQVVPKEVGYINEILTKRSLRDIITERGCYYGRRPRRIG